MYEVKMIRETPSSIYMKEFNGHEIHSSVTNRKKGSTTERWEHLGKYSRSVNGLKNQLLLMGYSEVRT